MIQPQYVTQNDYGYQLPFTLEDGNGNPVDISSATLVLNVQDSQDPTQTLLLGGSMTVDDGPSGTCYYTPASGDFPSVGTFLAQVQATWSPTQQLTWSGIKIIVTPALPQSNN
jgi:hypothetical protein